MKLTQTGIGAMTHIGSISGRLGSKYLPMQGVGDGATTFRVMGRVRPDAPWQQIRAPSTADFLETMGWVPFIQLEVTSGTGTVSLHVGGTPLLNQIAGTATAPPVAPVTWNVPNGSDWTPSNGGLTAERTAASAFWAILYGSKASNNGSFKLHRDTAGSAVFNFLGVGLPGITEFPGQSGSLPNSEGVGWRDNGEIWSVGGVAYTTAPWGTAEPKIAVNGAVLKFYLDATLVYTLDMSDLAYGMSAAMRAGPPLYPILAIGNGAGFKATLDGSAW